MDTKQIYLNEPYITEFEATVKEANEKFIKLDRTCFYPNSGGQPQDSGKLVSQNGDEYNVLYVGKFQGDISHEVDQPGLKKGDKVKGIINWDRRYKLMKYHTASHIISAIINHETGAMITGNQLNIDKSRIDFSLEDFNKEKLIEYISQANQIIKKNLEIKWYEIKKNENPEEFLKLDKGLPEDISDVRIVEIVGLDKQPDGGTHVKNTSEIGELEFIKAENKGKNNRRMYFKINDIE